MIASICILVTRPTGEESSTLGVRTVYASHMGGIEARILFLEDGVYNVLRNTGYNTDMLEKFINEGGKVYCVRCHLGERGLSEKGLIDGVILLSDENVSEILGECEAVMSF